MIAIWQKAEGKSFYNVVSACQFVLPFVGSAILGLAIGDSNGAEAYGIHD